MAEPRAEECVCDLTLIMRARLLCGLYSRRAVPPRWRWLAKAYCLTLAYAFFIFLYYSSYFWTRLSMLVWFPTFSNYLVGVCFSLWTGDEYIYAFFARNKMTDITLDSPTVFNRFHRQIKKTYFIFVLYQVLHCGLVVLKHNMVLVMPTFVIELVCVCSFITKLLVMGLFNSRILVLRRRLERYGFRTIGRALPQPYCQIYDEIWHGLDATNNPLKLFLFFDLIFNSIHLVGCIAFYVYENNWQETDDVTKMWQIVVAGMTVFKQLVFSFGHVAFVESAAAHCEAMAVFTATQLIKTPSAEERRRMYELLGALEQRGARYRVLRALPLDARLVLQALGFCSAQALVLINILKSD